MSLDLEQAKRGVEGARSEGEEKLRTTKAAIAGRFRQFPEAEVCSLPLLGGFTQPPSPAEAMQLMVKAARARLDKQRGLARRAGGAGIRPLPSARWHSDRRSVTPVYFTLLLQQPNLGECSCSVWIFLYVPFRLVEHRTTRLQPISQRHAMPRGHAPSSRATTPAHDHATSPRHGHAHSTRALRDRPLWRPYVMTSPASRPQ